MRIPLLHADFERGSYTKIAKALRKIWPLGDQSLMKAQNSLAIVLGYNNLHHAQREATESFCVPEGSLSMQRIANTVAWHMFIDYDIDLLLAQTLVSKLHLNELAVTAITLEEKMRRTVEDAAKKGFLYDETWDYMNHREPWPEQTPRLLRKGVPAYTWAIYPDRTVFLWSKLVAQIEMLPEDFAEDLRHEGKLGDNSDADDSFIVDSLMPAARQPLLNALASGALNAAIRGQQPWQVKWIVTRQAEVLGCCIVAEKLGGMVPRVFDTDGNDAYAALANLLCGDSVPAAVLKAETPVAEPVWLIDRRRLEQLKDGHGSDLLNTLGHHDQWPTTINLYRGQRGCRLAGLAEFSERGQSYLAMTLFDSQEQQRTLREEPIFETFSLAMGLINEVGSQTGLPAVGNRWHDEVEHMLSARKADVEAVTGTGAGMDTLATAVLAAVDSSDLAAFANQAIHECLPLRNEGDTEDNEDLVSERQSALSLAKDLGATVRASMPRLSSYSDVSLGYMALVAKGEYPGSRHQRLVDAPTATDWDAQSRLLAVMLVYETLSDREVSWTALTCAIAPVLGLGNGSGGWSKDQVSSWYQSACAVERHQQDAQRQLRNVEDWRAIEAAVEQGRARGEFLRTGDPIPVKRPKSAREALTELYSMPKSAGIPGTLATQDLSCMQGVLGKN